MYGRSDCPCSDRLQRGFFFGANLDKDTLRYVWESDRLELEAKAGDVCVLPAGISQKTYNALLTAEFASPGGGYQNG